MNLRLKFLRYFSCATSLFVLSITHAGTYPPLVLGLSLDGKLHKYGAGNGISNMGTTMIPQDFTAEFFGYENPSLYGNACCADDGYIFVGLQRMSLYVGAIKEGSKIFSRGDSWPEGSCCSYWAYEWYPTAEPWDTVWVVGKNDTMDLPYWPGYVGISDEDFVTRYSDYNVELDDQREPLFLDVIETSHVWSMNGYNPWILVQYYIVPTLFSIQDGYIGTYHLGCVGGVGGQIGADDVVSFDPEKYIAIHEDQPGHDDITMEGYRFHTPKILKIYPPTGYDPETLDWVYDNEQDLLQDDIIMYDHVSRDFTAQPDVDPRGICSTWMGFGPINLAVGDTLHFMMAAVVGRDYDETMVNLENLDIFIEGGFLLPGPPPPPPIKPSVSNNTVKLNWQAGAGEENPENYYDPARMDKDIEDQPFEGYRVYKSNYSKNGPWTLLAEYDLVSNGIQADVGLQYEYVDLGLLNNLEYYYSVTSFTKPDVISGFPSIESYVNISAIEVIPGTGSPESVGNVAVVPNPYRGDMYYHLYNPPWEKGSYLDPKISAGTGIWMEQDRRVQFINLPSPSTIIIYTLSGDEIRTLNHDDPERGFVDWNLTSNVGQTISSGLYMFSVQDSKGEVQIGKFVIIK